jgi:hypothetical protein
MSRSNARFRFLAMLFLALAVGLGLPAAMPAPQRVAARVIRVAPG